MREKKERNKIPLIELLLNLFCFSFIPQHETYLRNLKLSGHVGFDSLPDQLVNKSVQNGFVFNILCVGETGLGKSTLMDSLFNTNFESVPSPHSMPNVKLKAQTYELQESNVRLKVSFSTFFADLSKLEFFVLFDH